ncbi:hypothetical protein BKK51_04625 [Rodentibacter trehalosifermentans]|uniref:Uncharacterized protein n=1 Tax=Rodentibacter trehalosifermentans TaxID=1908263 RepID=A0A1V3IUL7_9PAST|nr:hypothetical protein [Rodentibacter trehalosifermentans]OOF45775.1 hypothetical protein BKK52_12085 [Rodentibacter trehalosifermentans]OOF45949.1 hypothetical protein BKK51_04625 [Rodentibacter trehalosifermentans]
MIIVAKESDVSITKDKEYFCFGLNVLIDENIIYANILRDKDNTPILVELGKFCIKEGGDITNWSKRFYLNGMRILIAPNSIIDFDWDLYHEGDENMEDKFISIYSNLFPYDSYRFNCERE